MPGGAARAEHPVRPVRRVAGRTAADRSAVLGERVVPHRLRARARDRLRSGPGAAAMRFGDPAADFVPAVERVFGTQPRLLDGSRAVLVGDVKLQLEARERELWLIERYGVLEHFVAMVPVRDDV